MSGYLFGAMILSLMCKGMLLKWLLLQEQESIDTVFFFVLEEPSEKKEIVLLRKRKIERPSIFKMERWFRTIGQANRHLLLAKEKFVFLSFVVITIVW
jgi:hypothetical protein